MAMSCMCGCPRTHALNRTRGRSLELRSRTSLQAHAELETGVAARKFGRCNEESRAAARACLAAQPALKRRRVLVYIADGFSAGEFPRFPYRDAGLCTAKEASAGMGAPLLCER